MLNLDLVQDLGALLLAGSTAFYLVRPHLVPEDTQEREAGIEENARQALLEQKERCVQVIKDLELDRVTGKIGEAEFERMRLTLAAELSTILVQLDQRSPDSGRLA